MSLFQFVDAQELCFIVMDIFRVPEILNFWTSKFLAIQTFLSEKFEAVHDEDDITKQQYLNSANSLYSILSNNNRNQSGILSTSEIFDDEKTQRTCCEKTSKAHKKHCKGPWTSTPLYTRSHSVKKTPYSEHEFYNLQRRISGLELEVCNLKKQVEILTKTNQMACHENSYFLPPIAETFEPDLFAPAPPPPPPPPPPPTSNSSPFVIKKKRSTLLQECNNINSHQKLDMGAILKGLKDVKLKPTERSPGGTPLRKMKAMLSDNPTDILQEALKRRFKGIHPVETHNKENAGDSWEKSPDKKLFSNP